MSLKMKLLALLTGIIIGIGAIFAFKVVTAQSRGAAIADAFEKFDERNAEEIKIPSVSRLKLPASPNAGKTADLAVVPDMTLYSQGLAERFDLVKGDPLSKVETVMRKSFSKETPEDETKYDVNIARFDKDMFVMRGVARGVADDSVKSMDLVVITQVIDKDEPEITDFGMRIKCWRGDKTVEWQTDLCP